MNELNHEHLNSVVPFTRKTVIDLQYQLETVLEARYYMKVLNPPTNKEQITHLENEIDARLAAAHYLVSFSSGTDRPANYDEIIAGAAMYDQPKEDEVAQ